MGNKIMIFAFDGDVLSFAHAMLNALDMRKNGLDAKLVIEGAACRLVETLRKTDQPFAELFEKVKATGLIEGVCKMCAQKLKVAESAREQGLPILEEMYGHPSMAKYIREGYQIITL